MNIFIENIGFVDSEYVRCNTYQNMCLKLSSFLYIQTNMFLGRHVYSPR